MDTPLNASASTAGVVFSNNIFEIPQYQREYSWGIDEVKDFWTDLQSSLDSDSYFLGLLIFTKPDSSDAQRKQVVDGQQRLITISLLASAIYREALARDRKALAERVLGGFLKAIDYETDEQVPRVKLSDHESNTIFQEIITTGNYSIAGDDLDSIPTKISKSFQYLTEKLREDLKSDPFKRLGKWLEFLTNRLYFAVFLHPDTTSAYQVFEVINTRGKDLTTADLLKNYVLSQTSPINHDNVYDRWKAISRQFPADGANNFVQFIRHAVTVRSGHVLPKDLFGFLAGRIKLGDRRPPAPHELVSMLENDLPLYLQMIDPTSSGPADTQQVGVFSALSSLGVLAVRPILLACASTDQAIEGMQYILRLVVRRMVVGSLGTGNVERKFGEAARVVHESRNWRSMIEIIDDLNPTKEDFIQQLARRSLNKQLLYLLRRSIVQNSTAPHTEGFLHLIWTKQYQFDGMSEEEGLFWSSTIGNTFISTMDRRPRGIQDWNTFKSEMLPTAVTGEWQDRLDVINQWNGDVVAELGKELARSAGEVWYVG